MMQLLQKAIDIAVLAHMGQTDKGGDPYIVHAMSVSRKLINHPEHVRAAAVLHDVVEDTRMELSDLRAQGMPDNVLALVDTLTKRKGEPYEDYIRRVARDHEAVVIKLADLADNMDKDRMRRLPDEVVERMQRKYVTAMAIIGGRD